MKRISRRTMTGVVSTVLSAPMICRYAAAAEISWRVGHFAPLDTPLHQRLVESAEAIAKRSDGRMELRIIGAGEAGIQSALLAHVRAGDLEMTVATCGQLVSAVPLSCIPLIGFVFSDYNSVWQSMDAQPGQMIRDQIQSQLNVRVPDRIWDFGFRHLTTSTKPVRSAADLAGLKIRVQIDRDLMAMFRALSVVPVVIALPYLRTALEHHQIDGQEAMLPLIQYARLNEVQPYCTLSYHRWDGLWPCINAAAWQRLPERLQHIVKNTLDGSALHQREDNIKMMESVRSDLEKNGMTFHNADIESFRDKLKQQNYYADVRTRIGEAAWEVVRRYTGLMA